MHCKGRKPCIEREEIHASQKRSHALQEKEAMHSKRKISCIAREENCAQKEKRVIHRKRRTSYIVRERDIHRKEGYRAFQENQHPASFFIGKGKHQENHQRRYRENQYIASAFYYFDIKERVY